MNFQTIGFTVGMLLVIIGIAGLLPAFLDWQVDHDNFLAFMRCSITSLFFGGALVISNYTHEHRLNLRETFLMTTLSWLAISLFGSFPLYFSDLDISFTDAFFESVSGFTTTGSTVLIGLDKMSPGILLWRSLIQWIGGIGIIAFAIVLLPFLRIGGMQLFQTESSDKSQKIMARTTTLVWSLIKVYCVLTALCIITYFLLGMNFFDAVNHALTTIPTGGYSTHDASFGYFDSAPLDWAASFFMLAGGIPFVLYIKSLVQGRFAFFEDEQFRSIIAMLIAFTIILTFWLWTHSDHSVVTSLRYIVFNVISVITTTGFATTDYTLWGGFAAMSFFLLTYLGACAGSTAGGIKTMRIVIAAKVVARQIKTLVYPHGVFTVRYQGRSVDNAVALTVLGFLGMYVFSNALLTIGLTLTGLDFATAVSGAATAIANVGPGIGDTIGPAGNFQSLPDSAKWMLCAGMLLGRLEIMTIFVLFRPEYWQS